MPLPIYDSHSTVEELKVRTYEYLPVSPYIRSRKSQREALGVASVHGHLVEHVHDLFQVS